MATRSDALAPTAFMDSTISDNSTPGSKINALATSSSTSISVSGVTVASPELLRLDQNSLQYYCFDLHFDLH